MAASSSPVNVSGTVSRGASLTGVISSREVTSAAFVPSETRVKSVRGAVLSAAGR